MITHYWNIEFDDSDALCKFRADLSTAADNSDDVAVAKHEVVKVPDVNRFGDRMICRGLMTTETAEAATKFTGKVPGLVLRPWVPNTMMYLDRAGEQEVTALQIVTVYVPSDKWNHAIHSLQQMQSAGLIATMITPMEET